VKKIKLSILSIAIALAFNINANAESMSKNQYESTSTKIDIDYKSAKSACDSLSANANDICLAEAKGKSSVAKANLEAVYKPSADNRYKAHVAKADADYAVAEQKCDVKLATIKTYASKKLRRLIHV
jgi:hypothetical protein